jgi:hypothetical protein
MKEKWECTVYCIVRKRKKGEGSIISILKMLLLVHSLPFLAFSGKMDALNSEV